MPPRKPKDPVDEKLPPVDTEPEPPNAEPEQAPVAEPEAAADEALPEVEVSNVDSESDDPAEAEATDDKTDDRDSGPVEDRSGDDIAARREFIQNLDLGPEPCPHGAAKDACPLCALDAEAAPAAAPEPPADEAPSDPEPAPAIDALSDEDWDALAAEAPAEVDLPLDEGEEITGQRVDEDGDLIVVTNFGRKVGISPDGWITVLTGPDIAARAPSDPKPPRASWKDLR